MKKKFLGIVFSAAILATTFTAHANEAAAVDASELPVPLQLALQGGLSVEKKFDAAGGLTGWIVSDGPGRNMVVFTSADGEVAIAGTMLSAQGENLTEKYIEAHAPKIDYSKHWGQLEKSNYVVEKTGKGKSKSVIYAFKDPNCGFCHLAWKALQPYVKDGLEIRWIPVAFLREDSLNKAADMLTASDKVAAIREVNENFGKPVFKTRDVADDVRKKVEANNKLMAELGFRGTPAIIYKDAKGKVSTVEGMPRLSQLPEMTGMPEKVHTDPELLRFQ